MKTSLKSLFVGLLAVASLAMLDSNASASPSSVSGLRKDLHPVVVNTLCGHGTEKWTNPARSGGTSGAIGQCCDGTHCCPEYQDCCA
ncbi:hypothetical protein [Paraburkholderia kururiensis]|uniref:hypothetical protein n=1 Tax=Paraburkholderia kururiensis TaxID=984307 RepID=UPI000F863515|nr:hypothetical protein [Paraburkholderia kururiensis]